MQTILVAGAFLLLGWAVYQLIRGEALYRNNFWSAIWVSRANNPFKYWTTIASQILCSAVVGYFAIAIF